MSQRLCPSLAAIAFLASACVPDFDDDLSQVSEPRILALRATPAEAKENGETTLEALVAVPEGEATPPLEFGMCLARKPLTQLGPVNQECLSARPPPDVLQRLGRGLAVPAVLPADACRLFGPLQPAPQAGMPSGRPVDPDVTGGFYQPFVAHLGSSPAAGAIRIDCDPNAGRDESIQYRRRYRSNENPQLSRVTVQGAGELSEEQTLSVRAGDRLELTAGWDECPATSRCGDGLCTANEDQGSCAEDCTTPRGCTGAEHYVWYDPEKQSIRPRLEGVTVAWYSSRGRFESEQTGLSEEEAASSSQTRNGWLVTPEPGPATLWLVVRDTRGGQSWRTFHVEVTP